MTYLELPTDSSGRDPSAGRRSERGVAFYLAMEEYAARHLPPADYFFVWQVAPSVIFGRNQQMASEVNVDYCQQHDIRMYRRKSGGGCVYADEHNLMLSYVTADEMVGPVYHRFLQMILLVLRRLGIEATSTSHNDVLIAGRKVCGTAFYHLPGRSIVHSTLLYDTNMDHMLAAITPSREKLQQHGVQSVRQRITLLKDYTSLTLDQLKDHIRQTLCDDCRQLTVAEVGAIEAIEQQYLKEEFIHLL